MLYVMEISETRMKIIFSSIVENITEVIEDAFEFLTKSKFDFDSFSFKLVMAEGLTNAVKHGNMFSPNMNTIFILDISGGKLAMSFEDQGIGFDWKSALNSDIPDEKQVSGRGLLLMKSYGFNVMYNDVGNKLTVIKT